MEFLTRLISRASASLPPAADPVGQGTSRPEPTFDRHSGLTLLR
jgi:hypothetical protein